MEGFCADADAEEVGIGRDLGDEIQLSEFIDHRFADCRQHARWRNLRRVIAVIWCEEDIARLVFDGFLESIPAPFEPLTLVADVELALDPTVTPDNIDNCLNDVAIVADVVIAEDIPGVTD